MLSSRVGAVTAATSRRLRYQRSIIRRNALKRYGRHSVSGDGKVRARSWSSSRYPHNLMNEREVRHNNRCTSLCLYLSHTWDGRVPYVGRACPMRGTRPIDVLPHLRANIVTFSPYRHRYRHSFNLRIMTALHGQRDDLTIFRRKIG